MRHSTAQSVSEQLSWKRVQTVKCGIESLFMEILWQEWSLSASCACKIKSLVTCSRTSKPLKKVRLEMWFDGENESSMWNVYGTPF